MGELLKKITKSDIRNILSIITVLGSFFLLYQMLYKPIPAENKDIVLTAVGFVLGGLVGGVSVYYLQQCYNLLGLASDISKYNY